MTTLAKSINQSDEVQYLIHTIATVLQKGLCEAILKKPQDPIDYLATYLYAYEGTTRADREDVLQAQEYALAMKMHTEEAVEEETMVAEREQVAEEEAALASHASEIQLPESSFVVPESQQQEGEPANVVDLGSDRTEPAATAAAEGEGEDEQREGEQETERSTIELQPAEEFQENQDAPAEADDADQQALEPLELRDDGEQPPPQDTARTDQSDVGDVQAPQETARSDQFADEQAPDQQEQEDTARSEQPAEDQIVSEEPQADVAAEEPQSARSEQAVDETADQVVNPEGDEPQTARSDLADDSAEQPAEAEAPAESARDETNE